MLYGGIDYFNIRARNTWSRPLVERASTRAMVATESAWRRPASALPLGEVSVLVKRNRDPKAAVPCLCEVIGTALAR